MTGTTSAAVVLGLAAWIWPVALGAALADRFDGDVSVASGLVYVAASTVCHQRPDRSFRTRGYQWPVCARCAGLYLSAPIGALLVAGFGRRFRLLPILVVSTVPTVVTWVAEFVFGAPESALLRTLAALPLGAALAFVLIALLLPDARSNRID